MYLLFFMLSILGHATFCSSSDPYTNEIARLAQQVTWHDEVAITPERILLHACYTRSGFICTRNPTEHIEHYLMDKVLTVNDAPLSHYSPYAQEIFKHYKKDENIKIKSLGAMHDKDVLFGCTCLSATLSSASGLLLSNYSGDPCTGAIMCCATFAWLSSSVKPALDIFMLQSIKNPNTKLKTE